MNSIVFITSAQPSANPRTVKEAISFASAAYQVTVIYCPLSPWADEFDKELFTENPSINWINVGAHPLHNRLGFYWVRLRRKYFSVLHRCVPSKAIWSLKSSVLYSQELKREALKHQAKHYRGHNLGALSAARSASKKYKVSYSFDAEDFHRGEKDKSSEGLASIKIIEDCFFKTMSFCTVASPLAKEKYQALYPNEVFHTLNNVWSKSNILAPKKTVDSIVDLVWFSQFVGKDRGIEQIVESLNLLEDLKWRFTLIGNITESYKQVLKDISKAQENLIFLPAMPVAKLFIQVNKSDIGFASEPSFSINNDIALSNKIFTYITASTMIFASDTNGQTEFMSSYSAIGKVYKNGDVAQLAALLTATFANKKSICEASVAANSLANEVLNWEAEFPALLQLVEKSIT